MVENKLQKLRGKFAEQEIEAILVTEPKNTAYLSGFNGTSGVLVITTDSAVLITDFRYIEQAVEQAPDYEIICHEGNLLEIVNELTQKYKIMRLGFESEHVTVRQYQKMKDKFSRSEIKPVENLVEDLRAVKEIGEIEKISKAAGIVDRAFDHILGFIKPGVLERDIAVELEYFMCKNGAAKKSFDTIVASGYRGALPHGVASGKKVENGDMIVMDFGAICDDYCSDMTRTVVLGKASEKQRTIYDIVWEAQKKGIEVLGAGKYCCEIDAAARDIICKYGYGDNFGHGLGHGVGRDVHEAPTLNKKSETVLQEGMVVTVEPGIYIKNWGGVRIEDMAVITVDGCRILTKSTKELIEL